MPPERRRTQQERRAETEGKVLDAAIRLIAKHGSRAVSLAEVGRVAGYSRGIVTHQFGSRQQLLEAVVLRAQNFSVPSSGDSGLDEITSLAAGYLGTLRDRSPDGEAFVMLWSEAVAGDHTLAPLFAERDEWFRQLLSDHLRRGIADGSVRTDVAPDAVAWLLIGMLRGTAMLAMSTAADQQAGELAAQAAELVRRGLGARE